MMGDGGDWQHFRRMGGPQSPRNNPAHIQQDFEKEPYLLKTRLKMVASDTRIKFPPSSSSSLKKKNNNNNNFQLTNQPNQQTNPFCLAWT